MQYSGCVSRITAAEPPSATRTALVRRKAENTSHGPSHKKGAVALAEKFSQATAPKLCFLGVRDKLYPVDWTKLYPVDWTPVF